MGFIGAFLTLDPGFNTSDLTNCYYIIDGLKYEPETVGGVTNENIIASITFNIYPTYNDRVLRQNLIGDISFNKIITRDEMDGNILQNYYIYSKPLIINDLEDILKFKLGIETATEEIPSEYLIYHTLTDHFN
jgi:hypothetical protein